MKRHLDYLVEQLWAPALAGGGARVEVDPTPDDEWREVESYWLVPDAAQARMLVPRGSRRASAAAVGSYGGLRLRRTAALKRVAATAGRVGVPVSRHTVSVQVRRDDPDAAARLPLAMLEKALGVGRLYPAIGVRTGDNRKATLALFDDSGRAAGYAKLGWDSISDQYVRTETEVLRELAGGDDLTRVPNVLASLEYAGHPVLVTQPLPSDVRGALHRLPPPTSAELYALTPVVRRDRVSATGQAQRLQAELQPQRQHALTAEVAERAHDLMTRAWQAPDPVPVTSRWHGDFVPWNRARDGQGRLWVWDWESSEPDAVAGLDALHWSFSSRRVQVASLRDLSIQECLADAAPHLAAAGTARRLWPEIASVYVLTVVERACALAVHHGSWDTVWIEPDDLLGLVAQAGALLDRP